MAGRETARAEAEKQTLGKTGKPERIPKDASQKQRWKGSRKVRVKRKGAP